MVLIILHIGIWIIMDIAPIGQMSLLFYFLVDTSKENKYQLKINHMN
jgi:hypothetical protein